MEKIPESLLIDMYEKMLRIRLFEEKIIELVSTGKSGFTAHLYIGEEAVAVGVSSNLKSDDFIVSTHRGHGHSIAKGTDVKGMMAELLMKKTGTNKGKGGSMHISQLSVGNLGANGIVGAGIPIATGAALSIKLRGTSQVSIAFFGESSTSEGTFNESLNVASKWKLPVVYICENNGYGMFTPATEALSVLDISKKAAAYDMPSISVDGMDVTTVYEAAKTAVERARNGQGPTLVECKTYRYYGHFGISEFEAMTRPYRTKEEIDSWRAKDPIKTFRTKLIMDETLSEAAASRIEEKVKAEIDEAVKYAENSPSPAPEDALTDLYVSW